MEQTETSPERRADLQQQIKALERQIEKEEGWWQNRRKTVNWFYWGGFILGFVIPILVIIGYSTFDTDKTTSRITPYIIVSVSIVGGIVALATARSKYIRTEGMDEYIRGLQFELDLLRFNPSVEEQRAEKLLRNNQHQLRRYYELALTQGFWIFIVGIVCLLAGFFIIGVAIWIVQRTTTDPPEQYVIGALGAIGAVLTHFPHAHVEHMAVLRLKRHKICQ